MLILMEQFYKITALALVTTVLTLVVRRQEKDFALLLTMAGCAMAGMVLFTFLEPVLDFLVTLQTLGDLSGDILLILLKAVGVGLVAEIAGMVCADGGNASLGRVIQLVGSAVILWLSLPIFQMLMDLMTRILGEV